MLEKRYIFLKSGDKEDTVGLMLKDVEHRNNVDVVTLAQHENCGLHFLFLVHRYLLKKGFKFVELFNRFWFLKEELYNYHFNEKYFYIIVFNDRYCNTYFEKMLNCIQKSYTNVRSVVHYLNCQNTINEKTKQNIKKIDPLISFTDEEIDAEEHGWIYWDDFFSTNLNLPEAKSSDLVFVGNVKGREKKILDIYEKVNVAGGICDFTLVGMQREIEGVRCKPISYLENLAKDNATNCILEITQTGQIGYTKRYIEAVAFNKKFITNNKSIQYSKFYNPQYMKIIENVREIDVEFVMKKEKIDYGYNGEFSVGVFLDYLDENVDEFL